MDEYYEFSRCSPKPTKGSIPSHFSISREEFESMKTKLVAIMLSLAIVSNTTLGAYTMTTPPFNSLVATTGFTLGGSRGGGAAVAGVPGGGGAGGFAGSAW